jgi:hypothetical protein
LRASRRGGEHQENEQQRVAVEARERTLSAKHVCFSFKMFAERRVPIVEEPGSPLFAGSQ